MTARPAPSTERATGARTRLALVRHGETVWHADNRYAGGNSDIDLTGAGRDQARRLAAWVATQQFAAVIASPVRRAVETARLSATSLGLELELVDDLREVDFGVAEGRTVAELLDIDADMVRRFHDDPDAHPYPGAEKPSHAASRAAAALRSVAERYAGTSVLVVAHNTLLRLALCELLDLPVSRYRTVFPRLDNGAVTELSIPTDGGSNEPASLLSLNARPWA